jgi:hypothetical protein
VGALRIALTAKGEDKGEKYEHQRFEKVED